MFLNRVCSYFPEQIQDKFGPDDKMRKIYAMLFVTVFATLKDTGRPFIIKVAATFNSKAHKYAEAGHQTFPRKINMSPSLLTCAKFLEIILAFYTNLKASVIVLPHMDISDADSGCLVG